LKNNTPCIFVRVCRVQWQEDFDCITPSLLAFFFRDSSDLTLRMEYLVATRAAPDCSLKVLFKQTNGSFSRKHPDFRAWRVMRLQKLQEKRARMERQQALAEQEAEQRAQALAAHASYQQQVQQQQQLEKQEAARQSGTQRQGRQRQ
jgi:hypothetical protein